MTHITFPSLDGPKPLRPASPALKPELENPAAAAPSPRETAGAWAPPSLASSASAAMAVPHFEKRTGSAPELPGISAWVDQKNQTPHPPQAVLKDLREAKIHFANLVREGMQTEYGDSAVSSKLIPSILHSENARTPGLNAVACSSEMEMGKALQKLSQAGGRGKEGHVRFHLGTSGDTHRIAVDAFRHGKGGFTLVVVDSLRDVHIPAHKMVLLYQKYPNLIKGAAVIPTTNLVHDEGCRIYAIHHLNALHDYQPYVQSLHRQIYDNRRGRPARPLSGPGWTQAFPKENIHIIDDEKDAFGVLPGKFFKHMQVMKPGPGGTRTLLDDAEERNPALINQALNRYGQTLRQRFASQNPGIPHERFTRADRTLSLDKKRMALIDRAIEHYEGLSARNGTPNGSGVMDIAGSSLRGNTPSGRHRAGPRSWRP